MRHEAIKKNSGQWVKIRPALQVYDRSAVLRETVEDAWLISDITADSLTIGSRDTGHKRTVGLDHVHNYMADPQGLQTLGTTGTLVLNVQLLLYEGDLFAEPVAPPGTPLKAFVPAKPPENLISAAARMRAEAELDEARRAFAWSTDGVAASDNAFSDFREAFSTLDRQLTEAGHPVKMTLKQSGRLILLGAVGWWVTIYWERAYANCLDESRLQITKWDGHPPYPGLILWENPNRVSSQEYTFGLAALNQPRWLLPRDPSVSFTTLDLAQKVLTGLLEKRNKQG